MPSYRLKESIQAISLAGSALSIPASSTSPLVANVGGKQYYLTAGLSATISGLTTATVYAVYLVPLSGSLSLVVSSNMNSVGPTGYTAWKLVGGIVATSSSTGIPIKNIHGPMASDSIAFTPVLLNTWTNVTLSGNYLINGESAEIRYRVATTGTPTGGNLTLMIPPGLPVDNTKLLSAGDGHKVGYGGIYQQGISDINLEVFYNHISGGATSYFNAMYISSLLGGVGAVSPTAPVAISNHPDTILLMVKVPIVGLTSTPLINQ